MIIDETNGSKVKCGICRNYLNGGNVFHSESLLKIGITLAFYVHLGKLKFIVASL